MRHLTIIVVITIFLIACKKEEKESPYIGEAFAFKNGVKWDAYTYTSSFKNDINEIDIIISTIDKENIIREQLNIFNLPLKVGKYSTDTMFGNLLLENFGILYTTLVDDGDVIGDAYYSPPINDENFVSVDSYNSNSGDLSGRFSFYLVLGLGRPKFDQSLPDTMRFVDGRFNVKIKK